MLERDAQNCYLAGDDLEGGPMVQLLGSSITYRIERRAAMPRRSASVRHDIQTCAGCDGAARIIAYLEDPEVIEKILTQLDKAARQPADRPPGQLANARQSSSALARLASSWGSEHLDARFT